LNHQGHQNAFIPQSNSSNPVTMQQLPVCCLTYLEHAFSQAQRFVSSSYVREIAL
jgi:hypothetical protein